MNIHGCASSINYLLSYMETNFQNNNNLVNKGHSQMHSTLHPQTISSVTQKLIL
jgi:hypothetical protein